MTREEYYEALEKSKELYHHGVKGQKWGIENGPPYPLDGDGKAALRAQKEEARERHDNTVKEKYKDARARVASGKLSAQSDEYKNATKEQIGTTFSKLVINEGDRARYFRNIEAGKSAVGSAIGAYVTSNLKDAGVVYGATIGAAIVGGLVAGPFGAVSAADIAVLAAAGGISAKRIKSAYDQNKGTSPRSK